MKGHIPNDHIRIERQTHHIAYDDGRAARPGAQAFAAVLIDLDRGELSAEPGERAREVTVAGKLWGQGQPPQTFTAAVGGADSTATAPVSTAPVSTAPLSTVPQERAL